MTELHRCEVEVIDPKPLDDAGILVCSEIRINGTPVYAPAGTTLRVEADE